MKELLIMRHAKSSWDDPSLNDHDRPLNKRGERDAPRMGRLIKEENILPDLIVSSTAKRAQMTSQSVAKYGGYTNKIMTEGKLYATDSLTCLKIMKTFPDKATRVMIVGHNPTFEDLVEVLCGEYHAFPTAALAYIQLPIKGWKEISKSTQGKLLDLWRPKELKNK